MAQMTITSFMTGIKNWVLGKIGAITDLIPTEASSSNKLADKAFVNSSIATATATFRGSYNVVSDLSLSYNATHAQIQTALGSAISTADNNDYAFVQIPTADATPTQIAKIEKYKYNGTAWAFEYELNNSGFTAAQWAAINSGITGTKVTKLDALPTNAELTTLLAGKQDVIQDLSTIRSGASAGASAYQKPQGGIPKNDLSQEVQEALDNTGDVTKEDLENGNIVPLYAKTLEDWADQKAIATPDTYTDAVRTTGGDIPVETSAGSKPESIKPVAGSKWTAKMLFNGSYNMLNAAKWGAANSQPYVGGVGNDFVYFLVPELTLGTFGTADENNGLLFTDSEGENVQPTSVYFKPLGATVPQSLTDGTSITPTSVSYDGNTYKDYETSGAGWLIIPKSIYDNDVCAHIAWEDWYDKHISLNEPTTNPEAVVGVLILEGLLALAHSDKYLRGINEEVCDNAVFGETSSTITHMVNEISIAAASWTNAATGESDSHGNALYRHSATVSGIKQGGAACIEGEDGGIPLTVNGTTVSYVDTNATAPASVVFYEVTATSTTKAYTDSVFNDSNINTETGVLPINDCSIEAQVAMDGEAEITVKYAKNIVDQVAINATVDVPQIKREVENHEERIEELEDTAVRTGSYDASVAVGLADNFKGDTIVSAEFYKRKTGGTQSVGSGIAAIKEVRGKSVVWNQLLDADDWVDMGLPSGTLWCKKNIDVTQPDGLAASEYQYECSFFSWGNTDGHNPTSSNSFSPYTWGQYGGEPYASSVGATLTSDITLPNDAANVSKGCIFRMPTKNDVNELLENCDFIDANDNIIEQANKVITYNDIACVRLRSKINGNVVVFPINGNGGIGESWSNKGTFAMYWTSSYKNTAKSYNFLILNGVPSVSEFQKELGMVIRPVVSKSVLQEGKDGHKFASYDGGITDTTLMYGSGNEPSSVADFEKMFPLDNYDYNEGEVIPFAAQNLVTTGKNQYNPATGKANLLGGQTYQLLGTYTNATIDGVAVTLDSNNCFTTTNDCVLDVTGGNDEDTFVGLYNGETNTYEPYEKHTLPLDPSQWRDKNGNLVFPYGGMFGYGTAYDYAKVDADGYIHKAVRVFERRAYESGDVTSGNIITDGRTYTFYQLAEPIEVELATPVYAKYLVDKDGTEEITPANGTAPYTAPANLSILYAMDARGEIKKLPKNYLSKESAENMLNAMVSAGVIASYTMTYDAANARYVFVIQKNSEQ